MCIKKYCAIKMSATPLVGGSWADYFCNNFDPTLFNNKVGPQSVTLTHH